MWSPCTPPVRGSKAGCLRSGGKARARAMVAAAREACSKEVVSRPKRSPAKAPMAVAVVRAMRAPVAELILMVAV